LEQGTRSLRSSRAVESGLEMREWRGILEPSAVLASPEHVERRRKCDAPSAECSWTQLGYGWSLFGLMQSLEAQGKTAEGEEVGGQFAAIWEGAGIELTESVVR
jgi:hypothetical protein